MITLLRFRLWLLMQRVCDHMPFANRIPWCIYLHGNFHGHVPEEWWERYA